MSQNFRSDFSLLHFPPSLFLPPLASLQFACLAEEPARSTPQRPSHGPGVYAGNVNGRSRDRELFAKSVRAKFHRPFTFV